MMGTDRRKVLRLRTPSRRWQAIAIGMAGLVAVTWVRAGWLRTLLVDGTGTAATYVVLGAAWFAFSALAMRGYLRATETGARPLSRLLGPALVLQVIAAFALPYSSNDLWSYVAYGRMMRVGISPYAAGPIALPSGDPFLALVSPHWRDAPSVYGPILAALSWVAGRSASVVGAAVVYKALMLGVTLAIVLVAYAICRKHVPPAAAASSFVLFAWNPLLAYEISGQAHNDGVMVLALAAFVWAALEDRALLAALFLAVGFHAKFAVAPVAGLYLVYLARRSLLRTAAVAGVFVVVGVLAWWPFWSGPETLLGPLASVAANPSRMTRSFAEAISLLAGLVSPQAASAAYHVCWWAGTSLLVLLAARAIAVVTAVATVESVFHESLVFLLAYLLVAAPFVLPWYVSWLLPLAAVERDARWRHVVALYSSLSVVEWFADVPPLQALAVNGVVLVVAARSLAAVPRRQPEVFVEDPAIAQEG